MGQPDSMGHFSGLSIQRDRNGTVIDQRHFHVSGEDSLPDNDAGGRNLVGVILIESPCQSRLGGVRERRPASFSTVRQKSELTDDQRFATDIDQRSIHLAVVVGKDSHPDRLFGQPIRLGRCIVVTNTNQNEQPVLNFANNLTIDSHGSFQDSLDYDSHDSIYNSQSAAVVLNEQGNQQDGPTFVLIES